MSAQDIQVQPVDFDGEGGSVPLRIGEQSFVYQIEGAPWWLPVNPDISYDEPGANYDAQPQNDDDAIDSVSVSVIDVPYFEEMAEVRYPVGDDKEARQWEESRRKFLLSIDYQINLRKFTLFTTLLLFLCGFTFVASLVTDFYGFKGWIFNSAVTLLLVYGLLVGAICSYMRRFSAACLLRILSLYWLCCWLCIFGLFSTGIYYLVVFPDKFRNHCQQTGSCTANTEEIIFAEASLISFLICYVVMILFYMQRVAHLVILIAYLKPYFRRSCLMRIFYRHITRYILSWKNFRRIMSKYTGLRMTDVLWCSCCFRSCRRQSARQWKPLNLQELVTKESCPDRYSPLHDEVAGSKDSEPGMDSNGKQNEKKIEKEQKQQSSSCFCCGNNTSSNDFYLENYDNSHSSPHCAYLCCHDCGACIDSGCRVICDIPLRCFRCFGNCICAPSPSQIHHHGDCGDCCDACFGILGCVCDGHHHCDCQCPDGDGAGLCGGIILGIACVIAFLLPLIVFAIMATPFWMAAQWLTSKLSQRVPWWIICLIFILFLIPPTVGWGFLWGWICEGNMDSTIVNVMCMIWSFFNTVMQALLW